MFKRQNTFPPLKLLLGVSPHESHLSAAPPGTSETSSAFPYSHFTGILSDQCLHKAEVLCVHICRLQPLMFICKLCIWVHLVSSLGHQACRGGDHLIISFSRAERTPLEGWSQVLASLIPSSRGRILSSMGHLALLGANVQSWPI